MIRTFIGQALRGATKPFGYTITRINAELKPEPICVVEPPFYCLLKHHAIETVIDVGANEGQFGLELRQHGFKGLIVSVEPQSNAFGKLQMIAKGNGPWEVRQCAAGDKEAYVDLNIAANSLSSSLLPMEAKHKEAAPESSYVSTERVKVLALDSLFGPKLNQMGRIFLKIDVQGFEKQVLAGADRVLESAVGVLLETSLVPLYGGSMCLPEALEIMKAKGFLLYHTDRIFWDAKTQQTLQLDCTFFKQEKIVNGVV